MTKYPRAFECRATKGAKIALKVTSEKAGAEHQSPQGAEHQRNNRDRGYSSSDTKKQPRGLSRGASQTGRIARES
jgi:hypothetical protein